MSDLDIRCHNNPFRQASAKLKTPETPMGFDIDDFDTILLGAGVHGVFEKFADIEKPEALLDDDGEAFSKIFIESSKLGIKAFEKDFKGTNKSIKALMKSLL